MWSYHLSLKHFFKLTDVKKSSQIFLKDILGRKRFIWKPHAIVTRNHSEAGIFEELPELCRLRTISLFNQFLSGWSCTPLHQACHAIPKLLPTVKQMYLKNTNSFSVEIRLVCLCKGDYQRNSFRTLFNTKTTVAYITSYVSGRYMRYRVFLRAHFARRPFVTLEN